MSAPDGRTPQNDDFSDKGDRLPFEQWRDNFLADAKVRGLLHNAEQLDDFTLSLFWRQGVAPTVRALLAGREEEAS
jgi:hypothetical protein